jgi:hypothetical protein
MGSPHPAAFPPLPASPAAWADVLRPAVSAFPAIVVAIPAQDEADRIAACLGAFAEQIAMRPADFGLLVLLNNCRDDTAGVIARLAKTLPFAVEAPVVELPIVRAHAGTARRLAMDAAAGWVLAGGHADGLILTTDADSRVARDWLVRQQALLRSGYDAVAGYVADDPEEYRRLPKRLRRRGRLEARYRWLLTEMRSRLDPDPDDPWPRHLMASGASIGVTLAAYLASGGPPEMPVGEDRAFIRLLDACGMRVRHCLKTRVETSCRLSGKAAGGMAETMRRRIAEPESWCDDDLERALDALYRNFWRGTLRRWHRNGRLADTDAWAESLQVPAAVAGRIALLPRFAEVWETLLKTSPLLGRKPLCPSDLPAEIHYAQSILGWLREQPVAYEDAIADWPAAG